MNETDQENFKAIDGELYEKVANPQDYIDMLQKKIVSLDRDIPDLQDQIDRLTKSINDKQIHRQELQKKLDSVMVINPKKDEAISADEASATEEIKK